MCVNNLPKVATQWNSGTTRDSNPGSRVWIPSVLTAKPLSHIVMILIISWPTSSSYLSPHCLQCYNRPESHSSQAWRLKRVSHLFITRTSHMRTRCRSQSWNKPVSSGSESVLLCLVTLSVCCNKQLWLDITFYLLLLLLMLSVGL